LKPTTFYNVDSKKPGTPIVWFFGHYLRKVNLGV
jgi:hypothetical protein